MFRILTICCFIVMTVALTLGQTTKPGTTSTTKTQTTGTQTATTPTAAPAKTAAPVVLPRAPINGRVVTEEGEAVAGTTVIAMPVGRGMANRQGPPVSMMQATTDEEGKFTLEALPPAAYMLISNAPGYVSVPADEESGMNLHYPGEAVTLTLIKGGVITGKVTNASGDPITGITLNAERVGNIDGEQDAVPVQAGFARQWRTDDQGVYRIYGLTSGSYIVQAGGRGNNFGPSNNFNINEDAPTFYPSAVREGAMPVQVYAGIEASGIDIRYRGERGRAVSGKVSLAKAATNVTNIDSAFAMTQIFLTAPGTDTTISVTRQMGAGGGPGPGGRRGGGQNDGFAFYGIPDGEYDVYARRNSPDSQWMSSARRIVVRGGDVAGIELVLAPLASVSGRIVLEKQNQTTPTACPATKPLYLPATLLKVERDEVAPALAGQVTNRIVSADQSGSFTLTGLNAGRYRLDVDLPQTNWYWHSLQIEKAAATTTPAASRAAAANVVNVVRDGITLKQGERQSGFVLTLREGAAVVQGTVTTKNKQKIHLIPAEKEAADNLLRYGQTSTRKDGSYKFTQLAPGKYWLVKQPFVENQKPLAWDNVKRLALRRLAETSGVAVEATTCQTVSVPAMN